MAPGARRACGPPRRRWPPRGRRACRGVWSTPRTPLAVRRSPARGRGGLRWAHPPGTWAGSRRDDCGPRVWRRCWHGRPPRGPGRARRARRSRGRRPRGRGPACPTSPPATRRSRSARPGGTSSPRNRRGTPSSWTPRTCCARRGRCARSRCAASRRARPRTRRTGRDEEVPAKEADGVLDGPLLVFSSNYG